VNWVEYLKEAGPFTAPLCLVGGYVGAKVIRYLLGVIAELKTELREERIVNVELRERSTQVQVDATRAMGEFGEQMRDAISDYESELKKLGEKIEGGQ
jgi:hypothetical protein